MNLQAANVAYNQLIFVSFDSQREKGPKTLNKIM